MTAHSCAEVWFHNACRSLVSRGGGLRSSLSLPAWVKVWVKSTLNGRGLTSIDKKVLPFS